MKRALVCLSLLLAVPALALEVHDDKVGYSVRIPDGYLEASAPLPRHRFERGKADEPGHRRLELSPLGMIITRASKGYLSRKVAETVARTKLEKSGASVVGWDYETVPWKMYTLDMSTMHVKRDSQVSAIVSVQVPLQAEALFVGVVVPESGIDGARADLAALLSTLDGASSWSVEDKLETYRQMGAKVAGLCLVVILAFVFVRRRKQRA